MNLEHLCRFPFFVDENLVRVFNVRPNPIGHDPVVFRQGRRSQFTQTRETFVSRFVRNDNDSADDNHGRFLQPFGFVVDLQTFYERLECVSIVRDRLARAVELHETLTVFTSLDNGSEHLIVLAFDHRSR